MSINNNKVEFNQFSSAALAAMAQPPSSVTRMASLAICAMVGIALVFSYLAQMDVVVTAQGKVIPAGKSKVVQPLEAGVVRTIAVRDGQTVRAGEVLLELDVTSIGADRDRIQRELWEAKAEVLRDTAQLAGRGQFATPTGMPIEIAVNQLAVLQSRLAEQHAKLAALDADLSKRKADAAAISSGLTQQRASVPLMQQKYNMREELAKTGHVAQTGVIESKMELINAEKDLAVQNNRLQESQAGYMAAQEQRTQAVAEFRAKASGELLEATKKRDAAEQEFIKVSQRLALQTLRSPIDGVIQQLAVTTVGGVVTAAQPLMTIVPADTPLELEAQVMNRDIGHVRVGQRVINKVETFDFTRYGYIEGEVLWVGTDSVQDQKLGPVFPVRIKLNSTQTPTSVNGQTGLIKAGMSVTADIRTDKRRLIDYLLAPMLRYKQEALRER
ncbi:MAG: secretion protein HlyD [Curvibacter sp. RIFCSPHIGHO2_12_FULL_63_18]|uniref:HlyD family type I secretion periplasmic adaptor subunit n=1 Tax=Rhodoferax sp. TaxID=50421 RepID=UPI0008D4042B|nr:HlyD family type I secretion periplasmic adaptor subunit [Rhodoferax sp.]OGO94401.1 MAG: secretion protein HlyD [Curvibacter sp. GWA2_63_95]OGP04796.1 MAG: secretion protein HlyD [Curvibacter sp. RIFCSPHIGHO2_12_FULL_63_18]HCX81879.1 HlyD family type I secretion periplasmic adaptor subunit [Rhodoferax sp.]